MDGQVIIPAPQSDFVELARSKGYVGRHFRKHILNMGTLIHPKTGERLSIDDQFYGTLEKNFSSGVTDIVAVPLANDRNEHVEDPLRNAGEVMGISRDGGKVYVDLDIRDPQVADRLGKTLLGASAMLSLDYTDTRTGQKVGPTLLHSCITNRPYCVDLDDYEEVLTASADYTGDAIVLAQEAIVPTKEELMAQLLAEHGIDVAALEAQAAQRADMSQLTAMLTEALSPAAGQLQLTGASGETVTLTDVVGAVAELAEKNVALSGTVGTLLRDAAVREVQDYIKAGRLLPKSEARAVELVLSGDRDGLDAFLAPENAPYVKLNHVEGAAPPQGEQRHVGDIDAEIAELTGQHSEFFTANGTKRQ